MEEIFKKWLIKNNYSPTGAANSYSRAIPIISEHYSRQTNTIVDIYSIKDPTKISEISHDYSQSGRFSDFGYQQHSRFRNAIARYSEFYVQKLENFDGLAINTEHVNETPLITEPVQDLPEQNLNFAYERDLQTTLCAQVCELFPEYKIFGNSGEGIEYSISNRRIDVLLEHNQSKSLLAVELKSGVADFKVFGQISMYIGLLAERFPDREIKGLIIAGGIDDSLRQACSITDKISLKIYHMSIELENA